MVWHLSNSLRAGKTWHPSSIVVLPSTGTLLVQLMDEHLGITQEVPFPCLLILYRSFNSPERSLETLTFVPEEIVIEIHLVTSFDDHQGDFQELPIAIKWEFNPWQVILPVQHTMWAISSKSPLGILNSFEICKVERTERFGRSRTIPKSRGNGIQLVTGIYHEWMTDPGSRIRKNDKMKLTECYRNLRKDVWNYTCPQTWTSHLHERLRQ